MAKEIKWKSLDIKGFEDLISPKSSIANLGRAEWTAEHNRDPNKQIGKKSNATRKARGYFESETHKRSAIAGGKAQGQKNAESGHISSLGKKYQAAATEASLKRITCPVCGEDANTGNYSRWHGENCIHPQIMQLYGALPNEMTWKMSKQKCKELGLPENIARKLIQGMYHDMIEIIHQGMNGSSIDVTIYRKKV